MRSLALIFFAFISYSKCRAINDDTRNLDETINTNFLDNLKHAYRVYEECNAKELSSCLKMKLIRGIERLSKKIDPVPIIDGVSLVKNFKDNAVVDENRDNEILQAALPKSIVDNESKLNGIIIDKMVNFFAGRSLQFNLQNIIKNIRWSLQGDVEDGRGKKNKYGSLMLFPLMMGGSMIPMALGTLALLAGKALIIAKLALTLSLIIGLRKIISHDDHGSYQVITHGGGHYRRSLQDDETAHSIAYRAYIPLTSTSESSTTFHYSS